MPQPLNHLLVDGFTVSHDFKSTLSVRKYQPPQRDRQPHGQMLLKQLAALHADFADLDKRRGEMKLPQHTGMAIAIEISPPGAVDYFKQLEWRSEGIEVLSAVNAGGTEVVALHVPDGRLAAFEKRVREYLSKVSKISGKPKHASLVNAIAAFRRAAFDELWTDDTAPPEVDQLGWFQVWLRLGVAGSKTTRDAFAKMARQFKLEVEDGFVSFPGRVVVAVRGTRASLEQAVELLDLIAEVRGVAPTASFFLANLKPHEQADWVKDLRDRTTFMTPGDVPYVTLLDTGINHGHPLLTPLLDAADMHVVNPAWGTTDHAGHGTEMAGLASHGDLTGLLSGKDPVEIPHRLESVKILPPNGHNPPHLFGWVTQQAALQVEVPHPERRRTFAMMTTNEGKTAGLPSEWSATIDRMAVGLPATATDAALAAVAGQAKAADGVAAVAQTENDGLPEEDVDNATMPRLFVLAAGNVPWPEWHGYPSLNDLSPIEDPGQAWNALTVGACTDLTALDAKTWPSLGVLAPQGHLAPASTTSLLWRRTWPFKPDVVAEGGNGCLDNAKAHQVVVGPESLRLLTTSHNPAKSSLAESGDTSGSAAEVARICGHVHARYPDYWPETVRALVVHGARITPEMRKDWPLVPQKKDKEMTLRRFGYGRVRLNESLNSTPLRPTMVLQETITPYVKEDNDIKLGELNLHALPWPAEALRAMAEVSVALRITLSYFVEPNPSRRGWQSKFRYQSHGLRFAVQGTTETEERFRQRINKLEREELQADELEPMGDPDVANWFLGAQLRARGSIHSDVWFGNAAQLAAKSHIAVYPVGGWWKDWKDSDKHSTSVRYALAVTLEVLEDVDVDLYTPIASIIGVPVVIVGGAGGTA